MEQQMACTPDVFRLCGAQIPDENRIVAKQQDAERWIVVDEDAAITVQHATTGSNDGDGTHAIALGHLTVFVGVDDLQFPEADQQQTDHAHDDVGGDGQPGLWQTIVVAKPVRHENPARECSLLRSSNGRRFPQGDSSPVPREAGTCSRHEKIYSVGFEMSVEIFFEKKFEKFPQGSRITAGRLLHQCNKVNLNVALGRVGRKPS